MDTVGRGRIVLWASVAFILPQLLHAAEPAADKEDVLRMVEAYVRSVQAVRYSFEKNVETIVNPEGHRKERHVDWAWDHNGREMHLLRTPPEVDAFGSVYGHSWDGERLVSLTVDDGGRTRQGVIEATPPNSIGYGGNPVDSCVRFLGNDTVSKLATHESRLLRVEESEDGDRHHVIEFELKAPTAQTRGVWTTLWFSETCGFAPVRRDLRLGDQTLTEQTLDMREIREGIWLPVSSRARSWVPTGHPNPPTDDYREGTITQVVVDAESYLVNEEVGDEDFELAFPVGTAVHDKIVGARYVYGDVPTVDVGGLAGADLGESVASLETRLDGLVAQAETILDEQGPQQEEGRPAPEPEAKDTTQQGRVRGLRKWWPIAGGVLVLVIAAIAVARRRSRRTRSPGA